MDKIAIGLAVLIASTSPCFAACDVRDFIVKDNIVATSEDVVRLSVLSEIESMSDTTSRDKIDAAALIPGYFQGSYSQDKRSAILQRQHKMLGLDLTEESRRTVIQSRLSDTAADMYKACLSSNGLALQPPAHAINTEQFSIDIRYSPGVNGTAADLWVSKADGTRVPRVVVLNGGAVPEEYWFLLPDQIKPDETIPIVINRNLDTTTQIIASIGNRSDSIFLPPVSKNRLVFSQKEAFGAASANKDRREAATTICVNAEPNETLFPETARLILGLHSPPNTDYNKAEIVSDAATEFTVCARLSARVYDDFTGGYVEATLHVVSAKVEPIAQ